MLVDHAIIDVLSGNGGDGRVSFARYKYIPKGGPDGGDGGNGGDVYLVATAGVDTLLDFAGRHHWTAPSGEPGGIKECHGAAGEHLDIKIPPGTLVYDDDTGELLADMDTPGQRMLIAKGGRGGFGNQHFCTPTNQAPRESSPGEPGTGRRLRLELKLIADVGLVGKPNAGKSTLLSRVSRARPKIADYPFTTLEPNLGIADLPGSKDAARRMVLADIPGLIEGAHRGVGLGTQFLRHVERTRLLVHLLEATPADGSDPVDNYRVVRHELANYSPLLAQKPEIVVLSKMDLLPGDKERQAARKKIEKKLRVPVLAMSAATNMGLAELLEECWRRLVEVREFQEQAASLPANPTSING